MSTITTMAIFDLRFFVLTALGSVEIYAPTNLSVQTGEVMPGKDTSYYNRPSKGLAGIQVLHALFLGSSSGHLNDLKLGPEIN